MTHLRAMGAAQASELVERFTRVVRDDPQRALIHLPLTGTTIRAERLWEAAGWQQSRLAAAGLGEDDLLLYGAGNRPELVALWLACRARGVILLPVDAGTTPYEMRAVATRFGARYLIVDSRSGGIPDATLHEFVGDLGLARLDGAIGPCASRGAAVLKLTSGSTGVPRATQTTEQQLIADVDHITLAMDIRPHDCQICAIPLSHAYGIGNLLLPLLVQGTALVLREGFVPHQFAADARAYHARIFPGVPYMFDHFRNHLPPESWPKGLDTLISAGARLEMSTVQPFHRSFGLKIHSFYGASETGGIAYDDSPELPEEGSVGRPMPGVTITLRPEEDAPAGSGRVHVAGGAVSSGYAGESADAGGFTDEGFLTGDYGGWSARGHLLLTGRVSMFINVAGRKVQPEEIEAVLRGMPGVVDVRVLGIADASRGQQIVACIVPSGEGPGLLSVRQFCAARLAPYKIPRRVVVLDRIPVTERGKTDRRTLEALVMERLREAPSSGVL